ncbi:unnamed protein product [Prorocentrum cordatum]|uniref:DNA topoisomerase (ATP-hydrolyzing) n=1 Tax=Prorocentrum cordatum TaxID=2364126 RepID=A0ABN9Y5I7_9DINO|nr:unnamed protein product [Polarella glacialis]
MWLFDPSGAIKKYETPEQIIDEFVPVRLEFYAKRKAFLVDKMARELAVIANKLKFVRMVVEGTLDVEKRKAAQLHADMRRHGLQTMSQINGGPKASKAASPDDGGPEGFKYLLSMKLWSLTEDRLVVLTDLHNKKQAELDELKATSLEALWERDLLKLEAALDADDAERAKEAAAEAKLIEKSMGGSEDSFLSNKQCVLVLSRSFTAKRLRTSEWKAKRRGANLKGGGCVLAKKRGEAEKGEAEGEGEAEDEEEETQTPADALAGVFCCRDFDALLVFSEQGMVYGMQALDVPLAKKISSPGTPMSTFLPELGEKQRVAALVTVDHRALRDQVDQFIILATADGLMKKIPLDRFRGLRPGKGVKCINLGTNDRLRWAYRVSAHSALVLCTQQGYLLRCSLGDDCRKNTLAGPGMLAMKMRNGTGDALAYCSISQLTVQEVHRIKKKLAEKQAKAEEKGGQEEDGDAMDEDDDHHGGSAQAAAAGPPPKAPQKAASKGCDDDDSDNNAAANEPEKAGGPAGNDSEAEAEADDGSDGEKPPKAAEGGGEADADAAAGEDSAPAPSEGLGQCALIVTEHGMGLRMPLCCARVSVARRGGRGKKVIKLADSGKKPDQVVAVAIVSGRGEVKAPTTAHNALHFYTLDHKDEEPAAAEAARDPEVEASQNTFFKQRADMAERLRNEPEEVQQRYQRQAEADKRRYEEELEEYKRQDIEEVMLGSTNGCITRMQTGAIPVVNKPLRGKTLAKLGGKDKFCTVSLLSSMDDDKDEEAKPAEPAKPAPPRPAPVPRARAASSKAPASAAPHTTADGPAADGPSRRSPAKQQSVPTPVRARGKVSAPGSPTSSPKRLALLSRGCLRTALTRLSIVKAKVRTMGAARREQQELTFSVPKWADQAA